MVDGKWGKRFFFDVSTNVTAVPNLLLKYYRHLGLSEEDLVFIIQFLRISEKGCPTVEQIAEYLDTDVSEVKKIMASLMEKGIIITECRYNSRQARVPCYFIDGLYDKLMDFWACQMAGEGNNSFVVSEESQVSIKVSQKKDFSAVYIAFEKEFGRALSPMENEKIIEWLDKLAYRPEIVLESLKRAVLRGIYNFNYIDRILLEWQKSNLRTLNDVQKFESEKMNREKTVRKKTAAVTRNPRVKSIYEM